MKPMKPMNTGPKWWPGDLGEPGTSGSQDDVRYAFFPEKQRLAIERGGKVTVYDSGSHEITGVSQQQSGGSSLAFSSQRGEVKIEELKIVS